MSIFEFVMVMVSLILALALAQGLRGLTEIATSERRYLPHTVWVVTVVFLIIQTWWANWDLSAIEEWTFWKYLFSIATPCMTFAIVYLLVPATRAPDVDWKQYFYRIKTRMLATWVTLIVFAASWGIILLGVPVWHPYRIFHLLIIGILITGIVSSNERVQRFVAIGALAVLFVSQIIIRGQAGALIQQ